MRYKNYFLVLLMAILAFNYIDRLVLGVVLQDIKTDLHLTDTQLGLLSGIAFALFYSVMGIPIARWADRGNRVTIISLTTAVWSTAVALCGMAGSFLQLLSIRVAVGVGEAGCIPPAHSLIADEFTRAERPRAAARYMLGVPLALMLGYFAAGWFNELYGWRATGELGIWLAVVSGGGALLGIYVGGEWATRCAASNERLQLLAVAAMFSFFAVSNAAAYLSPKTGCIRKSSCPRLDPPTLENDND